MPAVDETGVAQEVRVRDRAESHSSARRRVGNATANAVAVALRQLTELE
jgi:hypothetical protein